MSPAIMMTSPSRFLDSIAALAVAIVSLVPGLGQYTLYESTDRFFVDGGLRLGPLGLGSALPVIRPAFTYLGQFLFDDTPNEILVVWWFDLGVLNYIWGQSTLGGRRYGDLDHSPPGPRPVSGLLSRFLSASGGDGYGDDRCGIG